MGQVPPELAERTETAEEAAPKALMTTDEPAPGLPGAPAPDQAPDQSPARPRLPLPLPLHVRIGLFLIGWLLVLVGVAGLVLPGIQGVLTILVGAALLSLVSEIAYELLRRSLGRWPRAWDRVERFRDRAHDRLHRWFHRDDGDGGEPPPA
jgi:putative transmembrane protein PGPGW